MTPNAAQPNIQSRKDLFDFLQDQMQAAYPALREKQRLEFESSLIKSYILEVDQHTVDGNIAAASGPTPDHLQGLFATPDSRVARARVIQKAEPGFFELQVNHRNSPITLYLDASTNPRFWLAFSISGARPLDAWLEAVAQSQTSLDFVWLWPSLLESIQARGEPRGFGLDYDYRKFAEESDDATPYLKMQLWGGSDTQDVYELLKGSSGLQGKIILSKVRLKEFADTSDYDLFALQDVKYNGKFATRGTDFNTHIATLSYVRSVYERIVDSIESKYTIRWPDRGDRGAFPEGYGINFIPDGFELPVKRFYERVFDGTSPFRLLGFAAEITDKLVSAEVVDLHTGGELSMEVYPDLLTVYLHGGTCGNSIIRLYTNLQHFFNGRFRVEADNGDRLF